MKLLQIPQDIVSLARFKAQLHDEQRPVVVTRNGQPAAVLITPEELDRFQGHGRFLEAVSAGLADSRE